MTRLLPLALLLLLPLSLLPVRAQAPAKGEPITFPVRTRVEPFKGGGEWYEVNLTLALPPGKTALVICDVWDKHWCESATTRCDALAKKMGPLVQALRARGVTIIHAPSDTMDFYKATPQRRRAQGAPRAEQPKMANLPDVPLPIDDSDGGCDDAAPRKSYRAWSRQHAAITVGPDDYVSDNGPEVYNVLKSQGIENLFIMGVHTNMCVLNRGFAIKQMTRWGIRCVLIRDLTDAMYNPKMKPFVSHDAGTNLVIQHIEKHWCPTCLSADLPVK